MNKIRVGVIGVGSIGKNHARVVSEIPEAHFTAIYDSNHAAAEEMAKRFNTKAVRSLEEFADLVDAASVATPTPTHHEVGMYLLGQGKHLLIEKPIDES